MEKKLALENSAAIFFFLQLKKKTNMAHQIDYVVNRIQSL